MNFRDNELDPRPIGVFDSGIGGLTVLQELEIAFPNENFIYLGDTARLPYGSKSPDTIQRYVKQNVNFFLGTQDIKALVIACNSASTVLEHIDLPKTLPTFGVILPGANAAHQMSSTKNIGLWATRATVHGKSYEQALKKIDDQVHLTSVACPLLVPLVEEGLWDHDLTLRIFDLYLPSLKEAHVDTLILGCTHYPLLKNRLLGHLESKGWSLKVVDSAVALTEDVKMALSHKKIKPSDKKLGPPRLYLTDEAEHFKNVVRLAFPQWNKASIQWVNI